MGVEQELKIITRAYNQAQQGLQSTAQSVAQVQKAADQAATSTGRLNTAYAQAMTTSQAFGQTASGLYVPLAQVAEVEKKVEQQTKQTATAVDQSGKTLQQHKKETETANDAMANFYQTLGSLGLLRGFQAAVSGLIGDLREFNAAMTQTSIITEDHAGALQRAAMAATDGIYGPQELTAVYRDLGSAGLTAAQTLAASTPTVEFATAAMIDQAEAAQAVIAAASSFRIPFSEADKITDAFAEAMNRTTLQGRDLVFALGSIGPVAGMSSQGLGQMLAAVAALRNAGAQAQDAATSVRSAMLHLSAPSAEATALMKQLNIEIFDARGNMKQWADVVGEFERALQPYNQQTRNSVLATIFGTDGIRAVTAGMQMGSEQLNDLATSFENADGSARSMATAMADTLDGAIRRVTGNTQRAAIVIGQDLQPAVTSVVEFLNTLVTGFANLDTGTRRMIEIIVGGAGLVMALGAVAQIVRVLGPVVTALSGVIAGLGPVLTTVTVGAQTMTVTLGSLLGVLGLVAAAVGLAYGAWASYSAAQRQAVLAGGEQAQSLRDQADRASRLSSELQTLAQKTTPTNEEQDRLRQITAELVKIAPDAAGGINLITGEVTNLGTVLQGTNSAMQRLLSQSDQLSKAAGVAARTQLPSLLERRTSTQQQIDELSALLQSGNADRIQPWLWSRLGAAEKTRISVGIALGSGAAETSEIIRQAAAGHLSQLIADMAQLQGQIDSLQGTIQFSDQLSTRGAGNEYGPITAEEARRLARSGTGTNNGSGGLTLPGSGSGDQSWISAWKAGLQETMAILDPFRASLAGIAGELDILGVKQSYYLDMLADGRGGVEALAGAENARVQIIDQLKAHQDSLHRSNEASRTMLTTLQTEQQRLDGLYRSGQISTKDYAEASGSLRDQTERLTSAIYANSTAWWRDEQAIADAEAAAGNAEKAIREAQQRINDTVYQSATNGMRHEVAMKRLSVDQQITLIRQMLREMTLSTEQAASLQEQLFGLYSQKLQQEMDRVQRAYQDGLDRIENDLENTLDGIDRRLKATIDPLKRQLKDLEAQGRDTDRTRGAEEHNRKIADLQKQRNAEALRLGSEHQKKVTELDEQIAEENRRWQEQQDDWHLDDKKRSLQEQIDTAEQGARDERDRAQQNAKQQRKDLEAHYKEVQRITKDGILDTLAELMATDPEWLEVGETLIDQLIKGLESGDFSGVIGQINSVKAAANDAAEAAQNSVATSRQALIDQLNDQIDQLHAQWWDAATQEQKDAIHNQADSLRRQVENLGGTVRTPAYATGAWEIPGTQLALLHQEETVLPAQAATAFREFAPNLGGLVATLERLVTTMTDRPSGEVRVYGAENAYLEDQVDVDSLGRGVAREVIRLQPVLGR